LFHPPTPPPVGDPSTGLAFFSGTARSASHCFPRAAGGMDVIATRRPRGLLLMDTLYGQTTFSTFVTTSFLQLFGQLVETRSQVFLQPVSRPFPYEHKDCLAFLPLSPMHCKTRVYSSRGGLKITGPSLSLISLIPRRDSKSTRRRPRMLSPVSRVTCLPSLSMPALVPL